MPYSHVAFDPVVAALFRYLCPATLLDIGPGAGKYGRLMKDAEQGVFFKCVKTAVEINPQYVEQFQLAAIYDEIWQMDASAIVTSRPDLNGELAVCGDVIEHFPKSRGVDLIEFLLYRFRQVLVVFPIDLPQDAWEGHAAEAHLSLWYPEDFQRYKASTCVWKTPEGYSMCLALMNGVFVPANQRVRLSVSNDQVEIRTG